MEREPQPRPLFDGIELIREDELVPELTEVSPIRARRIIDEGVERASVVNRPVEDWVARHIAIEFIRRDEGTGLDAFVRTGEITEGLAARLEEAYEYGAWGRGSWHNTLADYMRHREDRAPVERWEERARTRDLFDGAWRTRGGWGARYQEQREIDRAIKFAQDARQLINPELAMRIMVQLAASPHSALARFVAEGELTDALSEELQDTYAAGNSRTRRWLEELGSWTAAKGLQLPVPSWRAAAAPIEPMPDEPIDETANAARRAARLADMDERFAPLEDLGDIPSPPPGHVADDGYGWMEALSDGWHAEPSWGRDGWDLGSWPYIVVALFADDERERYAVATFTEHDVTTRRYRSRGALYAAVNEIAEFHWRLGQADGPRDLPAGSGLLAKHAGPYSRARLADERDQEAARHDEDEEA